MRPVFIPGESLRWYLKSGRHPLKNYLVGHYWAWFCKPRMWIRYDEGMGIRVCLADYVQQTIFFQDYYERPLIDWLKKTLRPDDVFWDVGANVGAITLVAAPRCAQVLAFEPDPRSLARLRENVTFNQLQNVEIVPSALGAHTGSVVLEQAAALNTGMTSIVTGRIAPVGRVEVEIQRADDFLAAHPKWFPTVMKMDVEGAEHLVVQGGTAMLNDGRLRALVFEDRTNAEGAPTNHALVQGLEGAGYHIARLGTSDDLAADAMCNFLAERK